MSSTFFTSDDFDDVRGLDPWEPAPAPAPVAPQLPPAPMRALFMRLRDRVALMTCDGEFLALVDPVAYLLREQMRVQAQQAYAKGVSLTGAYKPVEGARNKLRHTLHATGVI